MKPPDTLLTRTCGVAQRVSKIRCALKMAAITAGLKEQEMKQTQTCPSVGDIRHSRSFGGQVSRNAPGCIEESFARTWLGKAAKRRRDASAPKMKSRKNFGNRWELGEQPVPGLLRESYEPFVASCRTEFHKEEGNARRASV
jgi:hypothetical protein